MSSSSIETLYRSIDRFNTTYPVGSEVTIEVGKDELVVTTVKEEITLVASTWPCIKTYHKEGYTWVAKVVEYVDKHPKLKEKRLSYFGY